MLDSVDSSRLYSPPQPLIALIQKYFRRTDFPLLTIISQFVFTATDLVSQNKKKSVYWTRVANFDKIMERFPYL